MTEASKLVLKLLVHHLLLFSMEDFARSEQGLCKVHPFLVSLLVPGVNKLIFTFLSYLGAPLPLCFSSL